MRSLSKSLVALVAIVPLLLGAAPAAPSTTTSMPTPAQACADAAGASGLARATDFACLQNGSVVAENAAGQIATTTSSAVAESVAETSESAAVESSDYYCSVSGDPERIIVDHLHETITFCVIYGQRDPDTLEVIWSMGFTMRVTYNLGHEFHRIDFRNMGGGNSSTQFTGDVAWYSHPDPFSRTFRALANWDWSNFASPRGHSAASTLAASARTGTPLRAGSRCT